MAGMAPTTSEAITPMKINSTTSAEAKDMRRKRASPAPARRAVWALSLEAVWLKAKSVKADIRRAGTDLQMRTLRATDITVL